MVRVEETHTALNSSNVNVEVVFDTARNSFSRALYNAEQVWKEHARGKNRELVGTHMLYVHHLQACIQRCRLTTIIAIRVYFTCRQPPSIADVSFVLAVCNEDAFQIGRQLETYMRLHPYALPMAHAFRYFGKVHVGVTAATVECTLVGRPSRQLSHWQSRPVCLRFDGRSLSATYWSFACFI